MDLALIVMLASGAAALGGRAQLTVARLAGVLGPSFALLSAALLTAALSAAAMALAGAWLASQFIGYARLWFVCGGLVIAALELAWPVRLPALKEPTRSLGAIALVLLWRQWFDAPRWIAFAGGAAVASGLSAGLGAAIGSGAAMLLGWTLPTSFSSTLAWRKIRGALAIASFLAALLIGYSLPN